MNRYDQKMQELECEWIGAHLGCQHICPTEEEIEMVEEALGEPLPSDYREFVRNYGTHRIRAYFPLEDNDYNVQPGGVDTFNGIIGNQHKSFKQSCGWTEVLDNYNWIHGEEGWPDNWLPIASGDGSDFYVMEFKGEDKGSIHYISSASLEPTFRIASSFDEFMQKIAPPPAEWD